MFMCLHRYDQQTQVPQWNKRLFLTRQSFNKVFKVCTSMLLQYWNIFCGSWLIFEQMNSRHLSVLRKVLPSICAVYFAALYSYYEQRS
jgi:hypothetical protein